jgi:mannose-6-phosphate isomerase-like protein (cupin superfamily)
MGPMTPAPQATPETRSAQPGPAVAATTAVSPFPMGKLEMHVVHSCNLSCESCSHYSNHRHKGAITLEEAESWLDAWSKRVTPRQFTLLGGEPTLHKDLTALFKLGRRAWPSAHLRIVTNGWYLDRHPELPEALGADPNCSMSISVHHGSTEYREKLQPIFDLVEDWIRDFGIRVLVEPSYERWTRRYKGSGPAMEPFDDRDPKTSWKNCVARFTQQIHEGKLWKCAPLAYLGLQHKTVGLSEKWSPYLDYRPLSPDCTDEELKAHLGREEESFCAMCPANPEPFDLPVPFSTTGPVAFKPPERDRSRTAGPLAASAADDRPNLPSSVHPLSIPLKPPIGLTFSFFPLLHGRTAIVDDFESHASVLAPLYVPHPPHEHADEELLIALDGTGEAVLRVPGKDEKYAGLMIQPGGFVYYPAFSAHTIQNTGTWPLSYLMFRWHTAGKRAGKVMERTYAEFPSHLGAPQGTPGRGFATRTILEGPTLYLDKLHCHFTELQPGAGYAPHADPYDVVIVVLHGEVETLGRRVKPAGVVYCAAGEQHGMLNPGTTPARYLVFEFHRQRAPRA